MTQKAARHWGVLGCAGLLGALIAFPVGLIIGSTKPENIAAKSTRPEIARINRRPPARDPYSPDIGNDLYVIDQHKRVAEALETSCRHFKSHCVEAEQARLRIKETAAGE